MQLCRFVQGRSAVMNTRVAVGQPEQQLPEWCVSPWLQGWRGYAGAPWAWCKSV